MAGDPISAEIYYQSSFKNQIPEWTGELEENGW